MLRLMFVLPFLASCMVVPDAPAEVALPSSSTGAPVDSSGTTLDPVMTSTEAGSTSSGETTGEASTSSSGDASSTSTASTGDGSTSTTGELLPACRNGDTEASCIAFISSVVAPPDLTVEGFNTLCTDLACNAFATCSEYRAVIRTGPDFWAPFAGFLGRYVLTDGSVVAVSGDLENTLPIILTEAGEVVPNKALVWTGYDSLFWTCALQGQPWIDAAADNFTQVGNVGGEGVSKWSAEQVSCDTYARVYCVEVPL